MAFRPRTYPIHTGRGFQAASDTAYRHSRALTASSAGAEGLWRLRKLPTIGANTPTNLGLSGAGRGDAARRWPPGEGEVSPTHSALPTSAGEGVDRLARATDPSLPMTVAHWAAGLGARDQRRSGSTPALVSDSHRTRAYPPLTPVGGEERANVVGAWQNARELADQELPHQRIGARG